jgi:YHS domain-containing protein
MRIKKSASLLLAIVFAAGPLAAQAAATTSKEKAKPYKLTTCIVSDEKLGEMGKPYVFTYEGQEIKLCCKSCKKDFDKDPKKYLKKLDSPKKKK